MNTIGKLFIGLHVRLFRATGGKMGGSVGGGKVLLLTTTGSKTGKARTVPVMYFESDGQPVVIASAGGAATHPAWFKNLVAKPEATIEMDGKPRTVRADVLTGEERARIWKMVVNQMPRFGEYEKKAVGREIPVVVLRDSKSVN